MTEENPNGLPRNVKVLSAVSLAQDAGSEMLYPLLPTFITGVLGAPVVAVGMAEGFADAAAAGMKLWSGRRSKEGRRKPWIAAGYGLAALGKLVVAVALVWPVVLLGRMVDRVGKGLRGTPRDALIADAVPPSMRGRAFGFHRAMDTLGAVIGPLVGLGLYHLLDGRVRWVLVCALVPAVVSAALVGLVREQPAPFPSAPSVSAVPAASVPTVSAVPAASVPAASVPAAAPERAPLPPAFRRAMLPLTMFALVNSTDALLLQRAHELGLGVTAVIVAYVVYNGVYAGLGYPAGRLADRMAPQLVMAAGVGVFAVAYVGLGAISSGAWVWALLPLYGVYAACTDGVSKAWISGLVSDEQRGWALGVHGAVSGGGVLVAGLWTGLLWGGTGRLPLIVSGVLAAVVALWLVIDHRCSTAGARER